MRLFALINELVNDRRDTARLVPCDRISRVSNSLDLRQGSFASRRPRLKSNEASQDGLQPRFALEQIAQVPNIVQFRSQM